jgi:hypothetical protein
MSLLPLLLRQLISAALCAFVPSTIDTAQLPVLGAARGARLQSN